MNMQVFDDKNAIEKEYSLILFREFLQRFFVDLNHGILWSEFIENARLSATHGEEHRALAASIFNEGWKLMAYALYQSRAPIDMWEDLEKILYEFFTDPDHPTVSYGQIAADVMWYDQNSLESFRHLRNFLDCNEEISTDQFKPDIPVEELEKIEREDLLRSLIKLAMLPSRRFPESVSLRDRQRWVFAEDLNRLIVKYLPESGIKTNVDELTTLIKKTLPRFKTKPHLLNLIKDYEADLEGEIYELVDLVEEPVQEPVKEVSVSVVVVDGKTHISGIGKQNIEFTAIGILKALAGLNFVPTATEDFTQEVAALLYKIMEILRGPEDKKFNSALGLLGDFRTYLYEIKKKLSKFHAVDITTLKPAELKQKCILDSLSPIEAEISEIMPMSFCARPSDGIRIQG